MKEELCMNVVQVGRVNDIVMTVVLIFEEIVLGPICGCTQQSGRSLEEKQSFYYELKGDGYLHSVDDLVMYLLGFMECMA